MSSYGGLAEELRLLGNTKVQKATRDVVHHVYSVRVFGEERRDPRANDYPGTDPIGRLRDSLQQFYIAVRVQLQAEDAENVLHGDVDEVKADMKPLSRKARSKLT